MEPRHDTSLYVRAAVEGDRESLGWLVTHLSPLLLAQTRRRFGRDLAWLCEPEDLVQQAWLTVIGRLGDLEPRNGRLTPVLLRFLSTSIVHRVANTARELARGRPAPIEHSTSVPGPADDGTAVIAAAVRSEQRRQVLAAIDALDPVDRDVLILRGVEQRPLRETGELLGITGDAVAMRYGRALRRLRSHLPAALLDDLAAS